MTSIELREKIQILYGSQSIKVSDFVVRGEHTLTVFSASNGNTFHIHGSKNDGLIEEKHRIKFYKEVEKIYDTR